MQSLTKAVTALPEQEAALVLEFLLERALVPPTVDATPVDATPVAVARESAGFTVPLSPETWPREPAVRGPRRDALLFLYLIAAGESMGQISVELGRELDVLNAVLRDLSRRLDRSPPLGSIFGELAEGRNLEQAAEKLGTRTDDLVAALHPSDALVQAICAAMTTRTALTRAPVTHYVGYSPRGPLRTMPVRLPEEHYQRLKDWCEANGFPMAVVVRGLVERFVDERQPPRA